MEEEVFKKNELVVIPDECGDALWDAVLQQQTGRCDVKSMTGQKHLLLNKIGKVQVGPDDKYRGAD